MLNMRNNVLGPFVLHELDSISKQCQSIKWAKIEKLKMTNHEDSSNDPPFNMKSIALVD